MVHAPVSQTTGPNPQFNNVTSPYQNYNKIQAERMNPQHQSPRYSENSYYSNQTLAVQQQQQQQQQLQQEMQHSQVVDQRFQQQRQSVQQGESHNMGDLSSEVLCIMYEREKEELTTLATSLKSDLAKLSRDLSSIRRNTPKYSVTEAKI